MVEDIKEGDTVMRIFNYDTSSRFDDMFDENKTYIVTCVTNTQINLIGYPNDRFDKKRFKKVYNTYEVW